MIKRYRITMQASEMYEVEAENEEEAFETIALGLVEPIDKEYFGDDNIWEVKDDSDKEV